MKVVILGAAGMLGHKLFQSLARDFDVRATIRGDYRDISRFGIFPEASVISRVDAREISRLADILRHEKPSVVINCIGIIKPLKEAKARLPSIWINSLFPQQLYEICHAEDIRLIHISTDCVFSGEKGNYVEEDPSDAVDVYGKTKYLGEIDGQGALTIRTSFIGRELATVNGLVEWFLSNRGKVINGYTNAIFSGFPTVSFTRIVRDLLVNQPSLSGIYHIASNPISKYDLLSLLKEKLTLDIDIKPYADFRCDRSLNGSRYQKETGFRPEPWDRMAHELASDLTQYRQWRDG